MSGDEDEQVSDDEIRTGVLQVSIVVELDEVRVICAMSIKLLLTQMISLSRRVQRSGTQRFLSHYHTSISLLIDTLSGKVNTAFTRHGTSQKETTHTHDYLSSIHGAHSSGVEYDEIDSGVIESSRPRLWACMAARPVAGSSSQ